MMMTLIVILTLWCVYYDNYLDYSDTDFDDDLDYDEVHYDDRDYNEKVDKDYDQMKVMIWLWWWKWFSLYNGDNGLLC